MGLTSALHAAKINFGGRHGSTRISSCLERLEHIHHCIRGTFKGSFLPQPELQSPKSLNHLLARFRMVQ
jgi:hypothetical protein